MVFCWVITSTKTSFIRSMIQHMLLTRNSNTIHYSVLLHCRCGAGCYFCRTTVSIYRQNIIFSRVKYFLNLYCIRNYLQSMLKALFEIIWIMSYYYRPNNKYNYFPWIVKLKKIAIIINYVGGI